MADFSAEGNYSGGAGTVLTARAGAAAGTDTVPGGSLVVARNTGAGSHTVIVSCNALFDGLDVPDRTHTIAAGAVRAFRIPASYADANGRVGLAVGEASPQEIEYFVIGA